LHRTRDTFAIIWPVVVVLKQFTGDFKEVTAQARGMGCGRWDKKNGC
jgi:hypothetical protein